MKLSYQVSTPEVYQRIGVTSYQGDFAKAIQALHECGYDGVELTVRDPKKVDLSSICRVLDTYRYEVPMICTGELYGQDKLSFGDPDDEIREEALSRVKGIIDMSCNFSRLINLGRVRGAMIPGIDNGKTIERIFSGLREVTEYAEMKDVVIAFEPVNTLALNYINSTLEGLELVKSINSPHFQLMVDTAHIHIEDKDVRESMFASKDFLVYVHLADSNRKYPGAGVFDFPAFMQLLREIGYDDWVSVEAFPIPDQDTALHASYAYIKPLL